MLKKITLSVFSCLLFSLPLACFADQTAGDWQFVSESSHYISGNTTVSQSVCSGGYPLVNSDSQATNGENDGGKEEATFKRKWASAAGLTYVSFSETGL